MKPCCGLGGVVVLLAVLASPASSAEPPENVRALVPASGHTLYDAAAAKLNAGDTAGALALFEKLADQESKSVWAQMCAAELATRCGDFPKIFRYCDRAIQINPTIQLAWSQRAAANCSLGRYEDEDRDRTMELKLDPDDNVARMHRALCRQQLGRCGDALADIVEARKNTGDIRGIIIYSRILGENGLLDLAQEEIELVIAREPQNPHGRLGRGMLHLAQGQVAKAERDFAAAVECDPTFQERVDEARTLAKKCRQAALAPHPAPRLTPEEAAVSFVFGIGGHLFRDSRKPGNPIGLVNFRHSPVSDDQLARLAPLREVSAVWLVRGILSDAGATNLSRLPGLTDLALSGPTVTDEGVRRVSSLRRLRRLDLTRSRVTDEATKAIGHLTDLNFLSLIGTQVTDAGLEHLAPLTDLRELNLTETQVSDAGAVNLTPFVKLERLDLTETQIGNEGLKSVARLKHLNRLRLDATKVTDVGLGCLSSLAELSDLNLDETAVTDDGLRHLTPLTKFTRLHLNKTKITGRGIKHLASLKSMQYLDLSFTAVDDEAAPHLAGLTKLVTLDLAGCRLTDAGFRQLAPLQNLTDLFVRHTQVSSDAIAEFRRTHTKCAVWD